MTREEEIVSLLVEAADAYYNSDRTIMVDKDYDSLVDELRSINPSNPFFSLVGFQSRYGQSIKHVYRMRSMQKCNIVDELQKFMAKYPDVESWMWEHKIDGGSVTLKYQSRKFVEGGTRGDGGEGQDVTHTLAYVPNFPKTINFIGDVEIRGEIILPKNTKFDTKGKPLRNSAIGLLARKTANMECTNLRFIAYNVICPTLKFYSEKQKMEFLLENGFEITPFGTAGSAQEIQKIYLEYHNRIRSELPYEIDGLIILPESVALQEKYEDGDEQHPAWAIAYKFPNEEKLTKIKNIEDNVSRLGTIVPVGIFEPINIGGSTIQRATLNNYENVSKLNLRMGDTVAVQKANDVIPYIDRVVARNPTGEFKYPVRCPSCNSPLSKIGVHLVCTNHHNCKEQMIQKILFWVQSCEMDGFSESTIRTLYAGGIVTKIRDLYTLKASQLVGLEGFGESRINNIITQIANTKEMTIAELISRLGIQSVGKKAVQNLRIKSVTDFINFNDPKMAVGRAIIEWKAVEENMELFDDILGCVALKEPKAGFIGKVCATGSAPMGRKELIKFLETIGYEWVDSVGKDTNLLLVDDLATSSSKAVKARKLGIEIKLYSEVLR